MASCHVWRPPIGAEARVSVDGDWRRSEAKRDGLALVDLALEWKGQFLEGLVLMGKELCPVLLARLPSNLACTTTAVPHFPQVT